MPINPARLEKLKALGLTEYQARAYLALLDLGVAPAKDVASLSRVPKSKIYSTLDQLHDKGLIDIIPEHPKRYRVLNIELYLSELVNDYQGRLGYIRDRKSEIVGEFSPRGDVSLEERGSFSVLKGRRNVETKIQEMLLRATERVLVYGTAMTPRRLVHVLDALQEATGRGVAVTLVAPATPENEESLRRLAKHVTHQAPAAARVPHAGVTLVGADGKEALLAHAIPDDAHFYQGDDVAVWTNDPALATTLTTLAGAPGGMASPPPGRAPFVLPEDLRRVASTQGHDPLTFLRLLGETLSADAAHGSPARPREAGYALGEVIAARLLDEEKAGAQGLPRATARLFRAAGLGEVTFNPRHPHGLEAHLVPGARGPHRGPWQDLLVGLLEAVSHRAVPDSAEAEEGAKVAR
ncbi:MAG TPA: helix-turn-helix domain-containing protein [Candidatus Thermoplasmatota archaeon]|nr:helix-turn-helix domain-containing protein [Candidatus Thermoplasmatota archaeon]